MYEENKFVRVLKSRKFWAAVVGLIFILINAYLNQQQIDPDTVVTAIMGIVAAYIGAVAYEDGKQHEAVGKMMAEQVTITEQKPQ